MTSLIESFIAPGMKQDPQLASYWSNITGFIHGDTISYNITPNASDSTWADHAPWRTFAKTIMDEQNMTQVQERSHVWDWASTNKYAININEQSPVFESINNISEKFAVIHVRWDPTSISSDQLNIHFKSLKGRIELTNNKTSEELHLDFKGVHVISNGSIYGFAGPNEWVKLCTFT